MDNHYFNAFHPQHPYTHSAPANPGTLAPTNALRGDKPVAGAGYWPAEKDGAWTQIEDHRGKEGWLNGEPFTISDFGPLPNGWSDTAPEPEPVIPSATDIRAEALRRINESGLPWMVQREVSGGKAIPQGIKDYAAAVRSASDALEIMEPIPPDYADDRHWPQSSDVQTEDRSAAR